MVEIGVCGHLSNQCFQHSYPERDHAGQHPRYDYPLYGPSSLLGHVARYTTKKRVRPSMDGALREGLVIRTQSKRSPIAPQPFNS